jgi:uncharacterized phiE125 gp8 family phage protein
MPAYRTVAPAVEPVSLSEVKLHIRQDDSVGSVEDAMLTRWIKGARERSEHYTQRAFVTQTWQLTLDAFPSAIELPWSPVIAVSSVKYLDSAGALQTLDSADYKVDNLGRQVGYIVPAYTKIWPTTYPEINAVIVEWTAGYGPAAADVPECVKDWMLLTIEDRYTHRGANYPVNEELRPHPQLDRLLDPVLNLRV